MALHLNFYHEIHKQQDQQRRDPVKLAWLGGILVMLCLVLWYFYRLSVVSAVEGRRNSARSEWASLEPRGKKAVSEEERLNAQQKSNQVLIDRLHKRFYWAPFLGQLATVTPANVQITALTGDLDTGKRSVSLLVSGLAAGSQPRTAAENYRRAVQESLAHIGSDISVVFDGNSLEDTSDTVQFNGQALGTASFRLRVQFTLKP